MSRHVENSRRIIDSLQILRGLFTILIFLSHLPFSFRTHFYKPSECAVTFFFMLSGFILSKAYISRIKRGETHIPQFMTARLTHIYPLHIIGLCGAIILSLLISFGPPLTPLRVIANILLIQSWFPAQDIYYSCNGVSWFLSSLLFCYLMFIPTFKLMLRHTSAFVITVAAIVALYLTAALTVPA